MQQPQQLPVQTYGKRGIGLHKPWADDRALFIKEVLEEIKLKPSKVHSLDRINNDGNYKPGNLRWATKIEQAANRSSSAMMEINGQKVPRATIAHKLGMRPDTAAKQSRGRKPLHSRVPGVENYWLEQLRETGRMSIEFDAKERRSVSDMICRLPDGINLAPVLFYAVRCWNEFAADAADGSGRPPIDPSVQFLASHINAAIRFAEEKHEQVSARSLAVRKAQWEAGIDEADESEYVIEDLEAEPGPAPPSSASGQTSEPPGSPGDGEEPPAESPQ